MRYHLLLIRGIYRADCKERMTVKKTALSDRRELVVFREWTSGWKEPDSYRAWSRHERFLRCGI